MPPASEIRWQQHISWWCFPPFHLDESAPTVRPGWGARCNQRPARVCYNTSGQPSRGPWPKASKWTPSLGYGNPARLLRDSSRVATSENAGRGEAVSTLTNRPTRVATRPSSARVVPRTSTLRKPRARARFVVAALVIVAAVGYMMYAAIQSESEYHTTTSEISAMGAEAIGQQMKIGGQVVEGSVQQERGSDTMSFVITDGAKELPVTFTGIIPDAFQPGAGVILEGKLTADGQFRADTMLAKCASKYEPK